MAEALARRRDFRRFSVWARKAVYVRDYGDLSCHSVSTSGASALAVRAGSLFHRNTGVNSDGQTVFSFDGCVFWQCRL